MCLLRITRRTQFLHQYARNDLAKQRAMHRMLVPAGSGIAECAVYLLPARRNFGVPPLQFEKPALVPVS